MNGLLPWILAALALGFFGLASWRGRWSLWVAGYLVVLVALALAILAAS